MRVPCQPQANLRSSGGSMVEYIYRVDELRAFQDRIFLQDLEILESKLAKKLPTGGC